MLMAGILAGNWGWESVFYVMGGLSLIWILLWIWLVQDSPNRQPWISAEERSFITSSLGTVDVAKTKPKKAVPWLKVLTSIPFYAILVAHICSNFGWYMLLIELPFYMKQVLKFNIKENAIATAVPFLTMWMFSMIISKTLDWLKGKGKISTTVARKIATLFASAVPLVCLLILCYIGCQRFLAVIIMGIGKPLTSSLISLILFSKKNIFMFYQSAITSIGGMFCGFLSNHIDIAPNFAGTLMALTNTAATIGGIFVPIFVGAVTHGNVKIQFKYKNFSPFHFK